VATLQAPGPLRLRPHGLEFKDLQELSEYLDRIQDDAGPSLRYFEHAETGGYAHRVDPAKKPHKASMASTSTCLEYLEATGALVPDDGRYVQLIGRIFESNWKSAGLPRDNAFTVSFLLEALRALQPGGHFSDEQKEIIDRKLKLLDGRLFSQKGGLYIKNYPSTAFLTYKAVKALRGWGDEWLSARARRRVKDWTWNHLSEESMLVASNSPDADYFELAYSVLTASQVSALDEMSPRERRLLQHALDQFFKGQRPDGTWPRSRPLFLYPKIGYAYCYDYELLVQLLAAEQLAQYVSPYLGDLRKAAWALESRRVPLKRTGGPPTRAFGWSSEHHGRDFEAESWPTASVFHFCFSLSRLVSDAIRREVFDYVDITYDDPAPEPGGIEKLSDIMDSEVEFESGGRVSFKEALTDSFISPLLQEREAVSDGQAFGEKTKVSAILYGPPGTSKTRLAKRIAKALGWPLLDLDPSHLTRRGMDRVHAEADALFSRLRHCDQVVVLMDEFDELVRERGEGEMESRFLTTAMLPKLAALHDRRRLVYLVATNHLEEFDAAISRPGRFDVIVPVMPPTAAAKLASQEFEALARVKEVLTEAEQLPEDFDEVVSDLTYDEAGSLSETVREENDPETLKTEVEKARRRATLNTPLDSWLPAAGDEVPEEGAEGDKKPPTWKDLILSQQSKIRGLGGA
jgi:ATPase family associated with various cellular activities (AAA)